MKTPSPYLLLLCALCALPACLPEADGKEEQPTQLDWNQLLISALDANENVPGMIALVDEPGKILWNGARKLFVEADTSAVSLNAELAVGSLSKMMIAVVSLQLIEEGVLRLDDPLNRWLSPALLDDLTVYGGECHGADLRVRHLIYHCSGIRDYWVKDDENDCAGLDTQEYTFDDRLAMAADRGEALARPGEHFQYSNTNFVLLGKLIEAIEGQRICAVLNERLFLPLSMGDTHLCAKSQEAGSLWSDFYQSRGVTRIRSGFHREDPVGGLVSTLSDLRNFTHELSAGSLFQRPDTLQQILADNAPEAGLGLAMFAHEDHNGLVWGHSDADPDYFSYLIFWEEATNSGNFLDYGQLERVEPGAFVERVLGMLAE